MSCPCTDFFIFIGINCRCNLDLCIYIRLTEVHMLSHMLHWQVIIVFKFLLFLSKMASRRFLHTSIVVVFVLVQIPLPVTSIWLFIISFYYVNSIVNSFFSFSANVSSFWYQKGIAAWTACQNAVCYEGPSSTQEVLSSGQWNDIHLRFSWNVQTGWLSTSVLCKFRTTFSCLEPVDSANRPHVVY